MDGIYLWDCANGECRTEQGKYGTPQPTKPGPRWLLILLCIAVGIGLTLYLRSIGL